MELEVSFMGDYCISESQICFAEFVGTAYQTEQVKQDKAVYWLSSTSFHWHFRPFCLASFVPMSQRFWAQN